MGYYQRLQCQMLRLQGNYTTISSRVLKHYLWGDYTSIIMISTDANF